MTAPDPHAPLFDMDVPRSPTPVEQLLALAGLHTRHNDRIDLLLHGHPHPGPDTYTASAHGLERETLACVRAIQQQRLPAVEPVPSTLVRLRQIAYLSGGAARYLGTAQHSLPTEDEPGLPLDRRRGAGQMVALARELTALASPAIIESAVHLAPRFRTQAPGRAAAVDGSQRGVLLMVARGHLTIVGQGDRVYGDSVPVDAQALHSLHDQRLLISEPASVPPLFPGGPLRDRAHLTALGISALSTILHSSTVRPAGSALLPTASLGPADTGHTRR
ncbi:hypothetical protein ACFRI7_11880 [Streptomyces sp. NPDC056716]|uniref:hypothetical protein n=1 Tax=unclassified Streptomyces TaxID=2593676 RepID=UPI003691D3ED